MKRMNFLSREKFDLKIRGAFLYEGIVDNLDYQKFYEEFEMQDTFFSWFLVTELHVWMLMLRAMQEGDKGMELRNFIVQSMWNDINIRSKKLGSAKSSVLKNQLQDMGNQSNGAILGYDEGILSTDIVFAGHI